jgi:ABC-2 type transport system permease protein
MNLRPLGFLLRKEFLQILRDRTIMGMLVVMPLVQLLVLANAVTFEVRSSRVSVVDRDRSATSRGLVTRLAASGRFVPTAAPSMAEADEAMLDRRADMILVIPERFERDLVRERRAPVQLVFNAEDGASAGVSQSYVTSILARYAVELTEGLSSDAALAGARPEATPVRGRPVIELQRRGWYNPQLDYRAYMVPGILVVLVTIIGTLLTAMNIVREKEAGTLDQLNVTPVTRGTFIAAKLLPLWCFAMLDLGLGLIVARLVFGLPVRGSLVLVFLSAAIYLVGALGIGLWISTVAATQQQAMFITFALLMVYLLMSGLFTPLRAMPTWAQWAAELNPIAHFVALMRDVLLKGAGLADVARHVVVLAAIGATALGVAVRKYSKRVA